MEVADTDPRGDIRDLRVLQPGGASRAAPDVAVVNEDVDQRESFGYRHWLSRLETPSGLSQRDFPQRPRGRSATLPPQILWLVPESAHDPRPRHRALDFPSRRALRVGGHRLGTTAAFCHDVDYPPAESTRARKSCRSRGWEHRPSTVPVANGRTQRPTWLRTCRSIERGSVQADAGDLRRQAAREDRSSCTRLPSGSLSVAMSTVP